MDEIIKLDETTQLDFSREMVERAYDRWAPIYDLIFDLPFHPGRLAAARTAGAAAGRNGSIVVVGVGTGLELGLLPRDTRVTGIDVSEPMLRIARERVARKGFGHVVALRAMDAGALDYDDNSFDVSLAPYVLSVVPQPSRVLDEMFRVTRPGGEIIVMNHFAAMHGLRARTEAALEDAGAWLGWHPNFPYSAVGDWLAAQPAAGLIERRALPPFKLFTLLRIGKAA
jgi:phosphatidylethanolamine/phosphatidyl-N-methylethanolamine N-methyltransferase